MGVRLFPVYDEMNKSFEERLAGVSAGTWERLNELDIQLKAGKLTEERYYELVCSDGSLGALSDFRLFGYGKLTDETWKYLKYNGFDTENGTTLDLHQIEDLLRCQGDKVYGGVFFELPPRGRVTGLSWH